jgi:hypothetical protein
VWKFIHTIKAWLLRQETGHASQPAKLWQLARKAKRVGKPASCGPRSKIGFEKPLPIQELPNQGFAAWKVSVVLNPTSTDRMELACFNF